MGDSSKERTWRLGDGAWENREFNVTNANTTVTCYFAASGTDSSNDVTKVYARYFALGRGANHINLRPSALVTITAAKLVNGTLITFKEPITVQTTGYTHNFGTEVEYFVILTSADNTNIKLEAN